MPMSMRERILTVYRGDVPDQVPFMLDLSHWFYHKHTLPWDLSRAYEEPERELIDYHKGADVGFYLANLASFYTVSHTHDVRATTSKSADGLEITWTYETPMGTIRRKRRWYEQTYAWAVLEWGLKTEQDLRVLGHALTARTFSPRWDLYHTWTEYVGDCGVVYMPTGYSAMGHLLHYWLGVEGTVYATVDWHDTLREVVDQINANCLDGIELLLDSPAEVIFMGDNFSSDIQSPQFFQEWSAPFYAEAIRRIHTAGKYVAVHIDGRLHRALDMFAALGVDCADAVTPKPMGDLNPAECRSEAGPNLILSGGVSPDLWLPDTDLEDFKEAVMRWLALRKHGPRLIANAGDQVPPGAAEERIAIMRDLIEQHGRY